MKSSFVACIAWLLNINLNIIPAGSLWLILGISIVIDFLTGIAKAKMLGVQRTSAGYRKTVVKFMQYGGAILVGLMVKYVAANNEEFTSAIKYIDYLTTGLLIFIIFIEVTSILENVNEMDSKTPFSRYIIRPLLKLFTFSIRNNPIQKAADEIKEP